MLAAPSGATPTTDESPRVQPPKARVSAAVRRQLDQPAAEDQHRRERRQQRRREFLRWMKATLAARDVSVYDLLQAECVLQPEAQELTKGQVRSYYLKLLYKARDQTKVPRQSGVGHLATLRDVLRSTAELRELAAQGIAARKVVYAEMVTGLASKLGRVVASPDETLMALMTRTREALEPNMGAPTKDSKAGGLQIRRSRKGRSSRGELTLEWRELEHQLRVYAANKPISYRAAGDVATAGAMLHVDGLEESQMSKMASRAAAATHDEQMHVIQQRCAREALGSSPLILLWDEGSSARLSPISP